MPTLDGVRSVKSTSQDGLSLVNVGFDYGKDVDLAAVDVQNAVARVTGDLLAEQGKSFAMFSRVSRFYGCINFYASYSSCF